MTKINLSPALLCALKPLSEDEGLPLEAFLTVLINEALSARFLPDLRPERPKMTKREKLNKINELHRNKKVSKINDLAEIAAKIGPNAKTGG